MLVFHVDFVVISSKVLYSVRCNCQKHISTDIEDIEADFSGRINDSVLSDGKQNNIRSDCSFYYTINDVFTIPHIHTHTGRAVKCFFQYAIHTQRGK